MPRKRNQKSAPQSHREDSPELEPTAKSSTVATVNRARKNSLKVKENEEIAQAIAASRHQRLD
jgi:hypothetical protein